MRDSTKWLGLLLFDDGKGNDALIWFKYWRPPIETLMNGSKDNFYAALQLMYPCMERVYQLKEGKVGERGLTKDVMKHFFPPAEEVIEEEYEKIMSDVANKMRHGLAHDASVREGVEIWDGLVGFLNSGFREDASSQDAVIFAGFTEPISRVVNGKIAIDARCFWDVVKSRIDDYYTSRAYLVNHYMQDDLVAMCNALKKQERERTAEILLNYLYEAGLLRSDSQ